MRLLSTIYAVLLLLSVASCSGSGGEDPVGGDDVSGTPDASVVEDVAGTPDDVPTAVDDIPADVGTTVDVPPEDLGGGEDIPLVCEPNSYRCLDGMSPQRCRIDGKVWEDMQPCTEGEMCIPDERGCARTCTPPDAYCANDTVEWTCAAGGYYEQRPCPEDSPPCSNAGHCILCDPFEGRCTEEGTRETCRNDGSGWDEDPCGIRSYCEDGACVDCEIGCLNDMVMIGCDAFGNESSRGCDEQRGERCFEGVGCAPCVYGDRRCTEEGLPQFCAPDSTAWLDTVPCQDDEACYVGQCITCPEAGGSTCASASFLIACPEDAPNEAVACDVDEICAQGNCVAAACAAEVILLIDRSGSMSGQWGLVEDSVDALFALQPDVRFGFLAFPGTEGGDTDLPPFFPETAAERSAWFASHSPGGGTPLNEAVVLVAQEAYNVWSLTNPLLNHFLIVLSDGAGFGCADHDFPIPNPTGDCTVDGLAAASALLYSAREVRTVAIGFNVDLEEDPDAAEQLLALTDNGGLSEDGFYFAGDEETLTTALNALFVDPKFCL